MLNRTAVGVTIQLNECLEIISSSLEIARDNKAFNKVLSAQLRLLLCDTKLSEDNSLINKVISNPSLNCINNQFISFESNRLIEFIPTDSMFIKTTSQLPLEKWLSQKVIKSNISYKSLESCVCTFCGPIDLDDTSSTPIKITTGTNECFVTMMCNYCASYFNVDLHSISNAYEGKIKDVSRTTITIRDIIKYFANKNGGAHIDSVLDTKGLLIAELGDRYIQVISHYIVEYFAEIKIK